MSDVGHISHQTDGSYNRQPLSKIKLIQIEKMWSYFVDLMFYFSTAKVILNCLFSALSVRFRESTYTSLREKGPYSEILWSVFSRICTEYGKILCIPPYSVQMLENKNQTNIKYGHLFIKCFHTVSIIQSHCHCWKLKRNFLKIKLALTRHFCCNKVVC